MDSLSNGDPLKWDEILNKDVVWFLNIVCFYRDKQRYNEQLNRKSNGIK